MKINSDIISKIYCIDWFSNCGKNSTLKISHKYMSIDDIDLVQKLIGSIKWQNYTLEAQNELTGFLSNYHKEAYLSWNKLVNEVKKEILPDVSKKIRKRCSQISFNNHQLIIDDIEWNVLSIIMSYSYIEYVQPDFYKDILYIYTSGHIPCGVKGKKGNIYLVIY